MHRVTHNRTSSVVSTQLSYLAVKMSIACMDSREKPTLGDIEHIWWGLQIQDYVGDLPHIHALIWLPMGSSEEHKMLVTTTVMNGSLITLFTPSTKAWVTRHSLTFFQYSPLFRLPARGRSPERKSIHPNTEGTQGLHCNQARPCKGSCPAFGESQPSRHPDRAQQPAANDGQRYKPGNMRPPIIHRVEV